MGLGVILGLYRGNIGDSFVARTCFYIEDVEYSEAHFYWPG